MKNNLIQIMKQETNSMSKAQRRVADCILKNPVDASFLTLEQAAATAGTSTATVMRLALKLGYKGYADFQRELQELLRDRVAPTTRLEINKKSLSRNSILANCAENQVNNIKKTMDFLSEESINNFLDMVQKASKIYIVGMRSSFAPAYSLYHELNLILGNCILLSSNTEDNVTAMLNITPSDLLIAISLPRYARATIEIARTAKRFDPKIVGITDGYSSPLSPYCDLILPCSFRSLAYHNSVVGMMFLIDFLITAIAIRDPNETKSRLESAEVILKEMNMHIG